MASNYNNFAMDRLDVGSDDASKPAPLADNDVESVNIRKADNGFIVDINRVRPEGKDGSTSPSKPEKPRVANSLEDLTSIITSCFGGGQEEQPSEERQPPLEAAGGERADVDSEP